VLFRKRYEAIMARLLDAQVYVGNLVRGASRKVDHLTYLHDKTAHETDETLDRVLQSQEALALDHEAQAVVLRRIENRQKAAGLLAQFLIGAVVNAQQAKAAAPAIPASQDARSKTQATRSRRQAGKRR
jgi:hypothetical protein